MNANLVNIIKQIITADGEEIPGAYRFKPVSVQR
jgi:hypothetical protein